MTTTQDELLSDMVRPDAVYHDGLAAGELRYQRCSACNAAIFYPRVACPACGGHDLATAVSAGRGIVYSSTAVRQRDLPSYAVTMVDLHEGFRMMSTVVGVSAEDIAVGQRVKVAFDTDDAGQPRAVFTPEDGA